MNKTKEYNAPNGIYFNAVATESKRQVKSNKGRIFRSVLVFALFVTMSGAFFSMAEISIWQGSDPDTAKTNIVLSFDAVAEGLKLICNQIFSVSEKYQAYEYYKFTVNAAENLHGEYIMTANFMIMGIIAALSFFIVHKKSAVMIAVTAVIITAAQIYFGIFPSAFWNVSLYSCLTFALVNCLSSVVRQFAVCFCAALLLVFSTAYIIYQGANPKLTDISEAVRNYFSEKAERPISSALWDYDEIPYNQTKPKQELLNPNDAGNDNDNERENSGNEYKVERDYDFAGARAGTANFFKPRLWILWLFIFMIFASCLSICFYRIARRRANFNSCDRGKAVESIFLYSVDLLIKFGLTPLNDVYAKYFEQIKAIISPQYAEIYLNMVNLWEEAVYSEHEITSEKLGEMKSFLAATKSAIYKKANILKKIKIALYCFYNAER